jgi:hypothetical protein
MGWSAVNALSQDATPRQGGSIHIDRGREFIMRPGTLHRTFMLLAATVLLSLAASSALAATIICIDGGGTAGDRYLNNAEGYYRQNYPGATIQVGGNLTDCLKTAVAGDTVIIVCHGNAGFFNWGGVSYAGFSGGRGATGTGVGGGLQPFPLPDNFTAAGLNITVTVEACFSSTAGAAGISVTASMQAALAAGAPAVTGSAAQSRTFRGTYTLSGGTAAQQAAAQACLQAAAVAAGNSNDTNGVIAWCASVPPANSPTTPNAQTRADAAINATNCPGAGGAVRIAFDYSCVPVDPLAVRNPAQTCDFDNGDTECAEVATGAFPTTWGRLKLMYR